MDDLVSAVASVARDVANRWDMPHVADMVGIRRSKDGIHVHLSRGGETVRSSTLTYDDDLASDLLGGGAVCQDLRSQFSELTRLEARARSLPEHDACRPPAWSLAIPRLFRDMLRIHGLEVEDLLDRLHTYGGWEPECMPSGEDAILHSATAKLGRLEGTVQLRGGTVPVSVISVGDEDGACTVIVHDTEIPDTLLVAIPGCDLSQVIDHHDLSTSSGHVVRQGFQKLSGTRRDIHLRLEPEHVWGGLPPVGTDVTWRDIREGRRLPLA